MMYEGPPAALQPFEERAGLQAITWDVARRRIGGSRIDESVPQKYGRYAKRTRINGIPRELAIDTVVLDAAKAIVNDIKTNGYEGKVYNDMLLRHPIKTVPNIVWAVREILYILRLRQDTVYHFNLEDSEDGKVFVISDSPKFGPVDLRDVKKIGPVGVEPTDTRF